MPVIMKSMYGKFPSVQVIKENVVCIENKMRSVYCVIFII